VTDGNFSDDEQWEKVKAWWKANGTFIIAGLVIGIVIIGGWRWWEHYRTQRELSASALYVKLEKALNQPASNDEKQAPAEAIGKNLIDNYASTPYAAQAALGLAKHEVDANHLDKAAGHLSWVVHNASDDSLARLARLRLAHVQIANNKAKAALQTLAGAKAGAFASLYAEARGDALSALGKKTEAHKAYKTALADRKNHSAGSRLLEMKLRHTATPTTDGSEDS
jgi:predicted negative regulator of RcsB-dependent stress response